MYKTTDVETKKCLVYLKTLIQNVPHVLPQIMALFLDTATKLKLVKMVVGVVF